MRYVLGIIVASIGILLEIITLLTQKDKSRKDIITFITYFLVSREVRNLGTPKNELGYV
jgi:hypothetical protein